MGVWQPWGPNPRGEGGPRAALAPPTHSRPTLTQDWLGCSQLLADLCPCTPVPLVGAFPEQRVRAPLTDGTLEAGQGHVASAVGSGHVAGPHRKRQGLRQPHWDSLSAQGLEGGVWVCTWGCVFVCA